MLRILLTLILVAACTGCSNRGEDKPEAADSAMEKAVKAPLVDLNLLRKKIPEALRDARRAPYQMPAINTCDALALEIKQLDSALGADLDRRPARAGDSLREKGAEEAGDAAADALKDLTTGWIPYRGWLRRLTGAERHSREVSRYISAGITRRAFLKGLGQSEHCVPPAAPAAAFRLYATWRLVLTRPAPWLEDTMPLDRRLLGQSIVLDEDNLTGPHPLVCEDANVEILKMPPEGLFEGGLAAPADMAAHTQGFTDFPVETLRVACANASFDLHRVDGDTLLFALDNQIWVLSSTFGTHQSVASPTSPEGVVQALLETHFAGDMGFTEQSMTLKQRWLSAELTRQIEAWFALPQPEDGPPEINGDPFTNSQEYPPRFAVDAAVVNGNQATVPVRFADAWRQDMVFYQLVMTEDGWRLDDVVDRQGHSLRAQLSSAQRSE